nr:DPP IV N-terminal domain-containing protein [Candidatus Acidoferrales bacterium]
MRAKYFGFILVLMLAGALCPARSRAQGTLQDYQRASQFLPDKLARIVSFGEVTPHWIEESSRFWYRKVGPSGKEFLLVDAAKPLREPAFDHARLAAALSTAARREYKATELPFDTFDFADGGKSIHFESDQIRWNCSLVDYVCKRDSAAERFRWESRSPDGKWSAYVRNFNLYLRYPATGQEVQLTRDGEKSWDYATGLPGLRTMVEQGTQDVQQPPAVFWSPDSRKLVTYRLDSRNAGRFNSLQYVPPDQMRPKAFTYTYPLAGEILPTAQLIIFDVASGKRTDVDAAPLDVYYYGGPGVTWSKDGKKFQYEWVERGYKSAGLRQVDAATGSVRELMTETAEPRVDTYNTLSRVVSDGGEVLWSSDRDGWMHLYLYDGKTGQVKNQVTHGNWAVHSISYVDEKARQVYFLAGGREAGEDPYLTHLYRVNLDGSGLQLLTPENANHTVSFSPDGKYFVDSYSRPDLPGGSVLRSASTGAEIEKLEQADMRALSAMGWKSPEPFHGKGADGTTEVYGLIWRPTNFNSSKTYPVVEQVYTGPHAYFVPKTLARSVGDQQMLAELGFIVVMVDGRGTTGRSRDFHNYSYRNLGGAFEDHVALIKQMAAKYPYMDLTRVGIYGTSAGGYGSAHAILVHPEFYKVCVSISGDHDPRLDKAVWNEDFQGYPVDKSYVDDSNLTLASHLQGHLLLVHGDVDDNVNPVETMQFVNALMKANKDFDMLFVPNMFHGEGGNLYLLRRRWDYFVKYLLGVTPPKDFVIPPAAPAGN